MKKFEIFTKENYAIIPANVIIVKNTHGWLFMYNDKAQWFMNHTNDEKDCKPEDYEKFLKKLVKGNKQQMKLI